MASDEIRFWIAIGLHSLMSLMVGFILGSVIERRGLKKIRQREARHGG